MLHTALTAATLAGVGWLVYRMERLMATKDAILAQIAEVKALLVETGKDVDRIADKLDEAANDGDLTAVAEAVTELHSLAQGINDRAEAADPEPAPEPGDLQG